MPHMHVEYSSGLDTDGTAEALCRAVYEVMVASPLFPLAGIRVRAFRADHVIVADDLPQNDFAALTLSVGAGRSTDALQEAGDAIFAAAQNALAHRLEEPHVALSLEIRVSDPELSWKDTPIHTRLSRKD